MKPFKIISELTATDEKIPPENQAPSEVETENETVKKRRGRKVKEKTTADYSGLANNIAGLHSMFAALTGNPVWELNDTESQNLADSLSNVMKHHEMTVNPVLASYIGLAFTAGMVYFPRFYIIRELKQQNKQETKQRQPPQQEQQTEQTTQQTETEEHPVTFGDKPKQTKDNPVDVSNFLSLHSPDLDDLEND